jgi:EAL domain-containing protein (putative c-di-GMP-specific phosphodiesterase class I)
LLPPDAFLPIAEESGLILPIGRWVLEQACQQANAWKRQFGQLPTLSINLSARQLQDPSLVDDITRGLRDAGLEPTDLKVEIAEHAAMIDPDRAVTALWQLQRLGVRIAIDDFGAGFSSLSHLGRLPVDTLQLDRMFVAELDRSREATAIAEAVIMLAHTLSLTVVAEGIERATQVEHLRGLGCELGQGDYFCEPLPGDVIGRLLAVSPDMPLTADPGSPGVPTVAP